MSSSANSIYSPLANSAPRFLAQLAFFTLSCDTIISKSCIVWFAKDFKVTSALPFSRTGMIIEIILPNQELHRLYGMIQRPYHTMHCLHRMMHWHLGNTNDAGLCRDYR